MNLSIFNKTFTTLIVSVLAVGACCAGIIVDNSHSIHANNMSQDTEITCTGSMHDGSTHCSTSTQHKITALKSNNEKEFSIKKVSNVQLLPIVTQNIYPHKVHSLATEYTISRSFQRGPILITQLPRAHLS